MMHHYRHGPYKACYIEKRGVVLYILIKHVNTAHVSPPLYVQNAVQSVQVLHTETWSNPLNIEDIVVPESSISILGAVEESIFPSEPTIYSLLSWHLLR